jgi:hypothetical protein
VPLLLRFLWTGHLKQLAAAFLELEIETLQNAPRDAAKLRRLLEIKQRQKEEKAMHIEDTERHN